MAGFCKFLSCDPKKFCDSFARLIIDYLILRMKNVLASLAAILTLTIEMFGQPATTVAGITNEPARRGGRGPGNSNDVFYRLGPDSKPMDGVPKGKFTGPRVIPSELFPGTTHLYDVYVPAQYDPATPVAVMIFNDGPAMKQEPGDL